MRILVKVGVSQIKKPMCSLLTLVLLQACVAYPQKLTDPDDKCCELIFRSHALGVNDAGLKLLMHSTGDIMGALVLSGIVFGGTAIVSGSVVLLGNTVHFLEKQGRCDDGFLNQNILRHNKPLLEKEGELINEPIN